MANWGEIKQKVTTTTNKVVAKTTEVADIAAKHVKLKALDGKISGKYEDLGRYYYKQLKSEQEQGEKISKLVSDIETLLADRKALKQEIEEDKQRRAEQKAEQKKEKAQQNATEDAAAEEAEK